MFVDSCYFDFDVGSEKEQSSWGRGRLLSQSYPKTAYLADLGASGICGIGGTVLYAESGA